MTAGPLVSVITAVYNGSAHLEQAIRSVIRQTYPRVEHIVIDGGSTDGSIKILEQYSSRLSYWCSEADGGIFDAFNKGVNQANGEWIYFLGADDFLWSPQIIETVIPWLTSLFPRYRVVYGKVALIDRNGAVLFRAGKPWSRRRFSQIVSVPHQGVFHHRSLFEVHGIFDPTYKIAGDYEFLLREASTRDFYFLPRLTIAGMRLGGVSSGGLFSLRPYRELLRARRQNLQTAFPWIILAAAFRTIVRRAMKYLFGEPRTLQLIQAFRRLKWRRSIC